MRVIRWSAALLAVTLAGPAAAQFTQYTAPGSLAVQEIPTKERLAKAMEGARWRLGGVRVAPWFGVRDATYYDDVLPNVPGKQSDFTITAGAGVAAFLPVGSKIVIAAHALPEYQWWQKLTERRTWNGRYGLGLAGYFNRLTLEVFGVRNKLAQYVSAEDELPVNVRQDQGRAAMELEVFHGISVYASGSKSSWRYSTEGLDTTGAVLRFLDRDETEVAGGVRWALGRRSKVSVGAKRVDVDFVRPDFQRSSHGTAPTVGLLLASERMGLDVSLARFTIDPVGSSLFVPYRGTTGRARVWRDVADRVTWSVYAGRDLGFSAYEVVTSSYYVQQRVGTALAFPIGWRAEGSAYVETGSLDYKGVATGGRARIDDFNAFGVRARFMLTRLASLVVGVSRTRYDSNLPGYDRTYSRIQGGVVFGTRDPAVW